MWLVMHNSTTKTVKVPEKRAEEWEEYVEDNPEIDSISHLIRMSVHHEMMSGDQESSDPPPRPDTSIEEVTGDLMTKLQTIETSINDLEAQVDNIVDVTRADRQYSLKKALYALLEPVFFTGDYTKGEEFEDVDEHPEQKDGVKTVRDLAKTLGADPSGVKEELNKLSEEIPNVQVVAVDDEVYAWKDEDPYQ